MNISRRAAIASLLSLGLFAASTAQADKPKQSSARKSEAKKTSPKQKLLNQFDANKDGKLGRNEKIAARPSRAAMRQKRALRRNAAVANGIL
jgi:hypothetical protein